jgi:hypothetical protein
MSFQDCPGQLGHNPVNTQVLDPGSKGQVNTPLIGGVLTLTMTLEPKLRTDLGGYDLTERVKKRGNTQREYR